MGLLVFCCYSVHLDSLHCEDFEGDTRNQEVEECVFCDYFAVAILGGGDTCVTKRNETAEEVELLALGIRVGVGIAVVRNLLIFTHVCLCGIARTESDHCQRECYG